MPGGPRPSKRTLTIALGVVLVALAPITNIATAHASPGVTIESKTAQAKRIQAQIDASNQRIDVLDEQYNQTKVRISRANAGIVDAQLRIEQAQRETDRTHDALVGRATILYTQAGTQSPVTQFSAKNVQQLSAASQYTNAAANVDNNLLAQLVQARAELHRRENALQRARDVARAAAHRLVSQRAQIHAALKDQQQVLKKVKGQLAILVKQAQLKAEQIAQAAARAAMANRLFKNGQTAPDGTLLPDPPAPNAAAQIALDVAKAQLTKPYVYAGAGPDVFDCSGLTMYAWAHAGVSMPHSAEMQYNSFPHVRIGRLEPGDLVFYGSPIHHVGMYVGNGVMIEAPHTGAFVRYASIYRPDFAGAARP